MKGRTPLGKARTVAGVVKAIEAMKKIGSKIHKEIRMPTA
jgi:hypothetical protein